MTTLPAAIYEALLAADPFYNFNYYRLCHEAVIVEGEEQVSQLTAAQKNVLEKQELNIQSGTTAGTQQPRIY